LDLQVLVIGAMVLGPEFLSIAAIELSWSGGGWATLAFQQAVWARNFCASCSARRTASKTSRDTAGVEPELIADNYSAR
jgi:hypothetical protein